MLPHTPILKEALKFVIVIYRSAFIHFLAVGISFAVGIIVARQLGPEARGTLNWFFSITTIGAVTAQWGLDDVSRKIISLERPHYANGMFLASVSAAILSGVVFLPAIFCFVKANYGLPLHGYFPVMATLYLVLSAIQANLKGIAAAMLDVGIINWSLMIDKSVLMGGILLLGWLGHLNVPTAFAAYVLGIAISMAYLAFRIRRYINFPLHFSQMKEVFSLFRNLITVRALLKVLVMGVGPGVSMFIFDAAGADQLGYYTVARAFIDNLLLLTTLSAVFLLPKALTIKDTYHQIIFVTVTCAIIIGTFALLSGFLYVYADKIILTLYGVQFMDAVPILASLAFYMVLLTIVALQSSYIYLKTDDWRLLITPATAFAVIMISAYLLVPEEGVVGAIYANYIYTAVSILLNTLLIIRLHREAVA
jgi:O-antigen/teichoic acid export membrane protein